MNGHRPPPYNTHTFVPPAASAARYDFLTEIPTEGGSNSFTQPLLSNSDNVLIDITPDNTTYNNHLSPDFPGGAASNLNQNASSSTINTGYAPRNHNRLPSYNSTGTNIIHLDNGGRIVGYRHFPRTDTNATLLHEGLSPPMPREQPRSRHVVYYTGTVPYCPSNRLGYHEFVDEYPCMGVCCGIFCFPVGLLFCLLMREQRCYYCGYQLP